MGAHKLLKLAEVLESLSLIPSEVAQECVDPINEAIRRMGRPGGPLRSGNQVVAYVKAVGNSIQIIWVVPENGIRASYAKLIERIVADAMQKAMARRMGGS